METQERNLFIEGRKHFIARRCLICNKFTIDKGTELHWDYYNLKLSPTIITRKYRSYYNLKQGVNKKSPMDEIAKAISKHFDEKHAVRWEAEYQKYIGKETGNIMKKDFKDMVLDTNKALKAGEISDDEYIEKIKMLAYANALADPSKVTVKRGLEAIKLKYEKEKIGIQKSESLRNWMKLISGKPDKDPEVIEAKVEKVIEEEKEEDLTIEEEEGIDTNILRNILKLEG